MRKLLFPLLLLPLFFPLPMSADENLCPQYAQHSAGEGFVDYESHEYINGFLVMHFKLAPNAPSHKLGTAYKLLRSSDCQEAAPGGWWSMGTWDLPQDVNNFSLHFTQLIGFGEYRFQVYNDDTNQIINCEACDTGFRNIVYFGGEPPHKFWLTLYTPYDFGYIPNLSVLPPTRFIASAQDILQTEYTGKTPVLIVPGIMGTEIFRNEEKLWPDGTRMLNPLRSDDFMDPLGFNINGLPSDSSVTIKKVVYSELTFDYSKKLIEDLVRKGYTEGQDLFTFPYDWRKNLDETAQLNLKGQIDYILNQTQAGQGAHKVDIIAHSQGGLVVKSLLRQLPEYKTKVNTLVFVGVPNLGSAKAAKVLLYGDNMDVTFAGMGLDPEEVKKISQNMPSVYQLLPSAEYFSRAGGYLRMATQWGLNTQIYFANTLNFSETTQYLKNKNLNSSLIDTAAAFHSSNYDNMDFSASGIKTYNIVGCQTATVGKIVAKPDGSYQVFPNQGDGTVPLFSADNIPGAKTFYALESNHGTMMTQDGIRQQILTLITGNGEDTQGKITPYVQDCHFNGVAVSSHSPVDLHIYDDLGHHVGPNTSGGLDYDIPNVGYESIGHENFAFLPEGGKYTVKLIANSAGSFNFDSSKIHEGEITHTAHYDSISVNPSSIAETVLNNNNDQNLLLDVNGDGTTDTTFAPSSILNSSQSVDFSPPISTSTLVGIYGQAGYYRGNVSVALKSTDPVINDDVRQTSGLFKIRYNLDNAGFVDYTGISVVVTAEGAHSIKFYATDKAGNNEAVQTVNFVIDKTPPEFTVQFNLVSKGFDFTAVDNQDIAVSIACNTTQCSSSDIAGNTSIVKFENKSLGNSKNLLLKSGSYNGKVTNFDPNLFSVIYSLNKGEVGEISQTILIKNQQVANVMYNKKLNQSIYTDWSKGTKPVITKLIGLKYLQLQTNNSKIKVNLK